MRGGGSVSMVRDLKKVRKMFDKGKYIEANLYSFVALVKGHNYNEDEEFINIIKDITLDLLIVIGNEKSKGSEKKIARELLNLAYGNQRVNSAIKMIAVVEDRDDPLVRGWKKHCLKRDKFKCRMCGDNKKLCVHHISYWSDDPVNRVNPDNGITLCGECHRAEHEGDWFANFI